MRFVNTLVDKNRGNSVVRLGTAGVTRPGACRARRRPLRHQLRLRRRLQGGFCPYKAFALQLQKLSPVVWALQSSHLLPAIMSIPARAGGRSNLQPQQHVRSVTASLRRGRCNLAPRALLNMFSFGGGARAGKAQSRNKALVKQLSQAISGTSCGLDTPPATQVEILRLVEQLKELGGGSITTSPQKLSATWKLLWTTEKETLFIIRNAWRFGTKAGDVYQVIDIDQQRLQNIITFPPDGAFIVDSNIKVETEQRVSFKFCSAKLKLPKRDFSVPPFGQGWFDTVYVDDTIRIAQDIRGDTLIVERDGGPRLFA